VIIVREPESIYSIEGEIVNGMFNGRWHFSFGGYFDPRFTSFGNLRVFNDDTLSPGAIWPLHPHREIEVVTYCAGGEFLHEDERGQGGVLRKGWVQHTTVGTGMMHSEINNREEEPMRFIQMWFFPEAPGLTPSVEQKAVEKPERTNRFLPLVSSEDQDTLPIRSDAKVFSSFLEKGKKQNFRTGKDRGIYLYVLEGGQVAVNGREVRHLGAANITGEAEITVEARADSELLVVDTAMS
jgi:redox-sensitive bicupin YhaK (pirin superfamily)